jgi:hypothetical protein
MDLKGKQETSISYFLKMVQYGWSNMVETNKISITLFCNQSIFCKIQSVTPQFTRSIMPNSLLTVLLEPKITFAVLLVFQFGGWP